MILAPVLNVQGVRVAGDGGPGTFNAVIVSGAETAEVNGTYELAADVNGRPSYEYEPDVLYRIYWLEVNWVLEDTNTETLLYGTVDPPPEYPWEGTWGVVDGLLPAPTLTPTTV